MTLFALSLSPFLHPRAVDYGFYWPNAHKNVCLRETRKHFVISSAHVLLDAG